MDWITPRPRACGVRSVDCERKYTMTFLWITIGVLYITLWMTLGLTTLRKGHTALFWFGIPLPFLWIVGALMEPTPKAAAAEAGTRLQ